MSDLRTLLHEAGSTRAGGGDLTDHFAAVRHRVKRRRAVRASGIGSAAAVSVGAMALGVAQVLPGTPQQVGPAAGIEDSASPSATPSPDPGPWCGGGPAGPDVLYSTMDCETGETLSTLTEAEARELAWLAHEDEQRVLLQANDTGRFVFQDKVDGEELWVEVDPNPDGPQDTTIVVHFDGAKPNSPASEVVELD